MPLTQSKLSWRLMLGPSGALVTRLLIGILLISTGLLKLLDSQSVIRNARSAQADAYLGMSLSLFEMLLGGWLVSGLSPRLARRLTIAAFSLFWNIALFRALSGFRSCGCMGSIALSPWYVAVFDLFVLLLVLVQDWASPNVGTEARRSQQVFLAAFCTVAAGLHVGVLLIGDSIRPANSGLAQLTPHQRALLDRVRTSISENALRCGNATFRLERVIRNVNVERASTVTTNYPNGSTQSVSIQPIYQDDFQYTVSPDGVRRDLLGSRVDKFTEILFGGRYFRIHDTPRHVVVRDNNSSVGITEPVDPWGLGFDTVLPRLVDWFAWATIHDVQEVQENGGATVIHVGASSGLGFPMTVDFASERAYLPTRVEIQHHDRTFDRVSDINYQQLQQVNGWFPLSVVSKAWPTGSAKSSLSPNHVRTDEYHVRGSVKLSDSAPTSAFDPPAGSDYVLVNNVGAGGPARHLATGQALSTGLSITLSPPAERPWGWLLMVNVGLVATCFALRKSIHWW